MPSSLNLLLQYFFEAWSLQLVQSHLLLTLPWGESSRLKPTDKRRWIIKALTLGLKWQPFGLFKRNTPSSSTLHQSLTPITFLWSGIIIIGFCLLFDKIDNPLHIVVWDKGSPSSWMIFINHLRNMSPRPTISPLHFRQDGHWVSPRCCKSDTEGISLDQKPEITSADGRWSQGSVPAARTFCPRRIIASSLLYLRCVRSRNSRQWRSMEGHASSQCTQPPWH